MTLGQGSLLHNRYRVVEILGRGGMGAVYRATDESLGVEVAVKENLFSSDDYARQFRMEAVILAGIRHPNLPRVTDHFVITDMGQYLVMDFIDGDDLRQRLEDSGPVSDEEAIKIGAAACDALAYLHSRKPPILHRDIKLGNIKITTEGHIYLVDFGLAKMGWENEETLTGARAMTPGYSPPEQYGSTHTDARSDIYSLGATLYAALTGIIPEDSLVRAMDGIKLTPLREHRPSVSPQLAAVIEKALETNPANRYQTAEAFKYALQNPSETIHPNQEALQTPPVDEIENARRSGSFWRSLGFLALMLSIVSVAIWFTLLNPRLFQSGILPWPPFLATHTPTKPATLIPSATVQPTQRIIPTSTPTTTASLSVTPTALASRTALPTHTPASSATANPVLIVASATPPGSPTATNTATEEPTITPSPTIPETSTATESPTSAPTLTPQPTPFGGGPGEIAFANTNNHISQIFLINSDGTSLRAITNETGGACSFDWSPNGKKLVYASPCGDKALQYPMSTLYILDVATGQREILPLGAAGNFEPAWSPDGSKIAFTSLRDGSLQIYVYDLPESSVTRLTTPGSNGQARYPAWSPDSSRIAYTVLRTGLLQIWSMAADGSNQQQVLRTGGAFSEYLPAWSRDGTRLVFSQTNNNQNAPSALIQLDLASSEYQQLPLPLPVVDAQFSPDGLWLIYESTDTTNQDIYLFPLPDGPAQRLTTSTGVDFDPVWRPTTPQVEREE